MERRGKRVLLWTDGTPVGRALFGGLLERTRAEIVLATPDGRALERWCAGLSADEVARVTPYRLGARDRAAIQTAVERVGLAIVAPAPLLPAAAEISRAALCAGVDYLDLAGQRESVRSTLALARELGLDSNPAPGPLVAPASGLTALAEALAQLATRELDEVHAVRVMLAPGAGLAPGYAERARLLALVGRPLRVVRQGLACTVRGWSEPARFPFPEPCGPRLGRLIDGPEYLLLGQRLRARHVELRLDERALGGVALRAWARLRGGLGRGLAPRANPGSATREATSTSDLAALGVELEGRFGRYPLTVRASAIRAGACSLAQLAALPALALAEDRLTSGDPTDRARFDRGAWTGGRWLTSEAARGRVELALERA